MRLTFLPVEASVLALLILMLVVRENLSSQILNYFT